MKDEENPADLMTKFLGKAEVEERRKRISVDVKWRREEEEGQLKQNPRRRSPCRQWLQTDRRHWRKKAEKRRIRDERNKKKREAW